MNRVVMVCRDGMDYSRVAFSWAEDFKKRTGREVEILDPDKEVGFCESYDIVEYPTILVLDGDGVVLNSWRGTMMPLFDEVVYYML